MVDEIGRAYKLREKEEEFIQALCRVSREKKTTKKS
jgi:hypothetical protein